MTCEGRMSYYCGLHGMHANDVWYATETACHVSEVRMPRTEVRMPCDEGLGHANKLRME